VKTIPRFDSIRTAAAYEQLLKALYLGVKPRVEEIELPPVQVLAVTGNEPPAGQQYQGAIAALYGIGYTLKMGLKFGKLSQPSGYFDYKVGALETLWWSAGDRFEIGNPDTLRWQAYLMVPRFVSEALVETARQQAEAKKAEVDYRAVRLDSVAEGHAVQMLNVGPYDQEQPTIDALHEYAVQHGLVVAGKHHEIYISDPRRIHPAKLKTVIRLPVRPADPHELELLQSTGAAEIGA
jgi:hypothetical protein